MEHYYVNKNKQNNGDNEVHKHGCLYLFYVVNKESLGQFYSCQEAVKKARERGYNANGCKYCANDCHTG